MSGEKAFNICAGNGDPFKIRTCLNPKRCKKNKSCYWDEKDAEFKQAICETRNKKGGCWNCRYSHVITDKEDESKEIVCRRFPPNIRGESLDGLPTNANYPAIFDDDWCGEWRAKG